MSENVVYKVRVGSQEYGADDKTSAESLAELLGGEVFTTSRKEALAHVRTITAEPEYPPALAEMLANVKSTIVSEITGAGLMNGSCFRVIAQYDSQNTAWYAEVKDLASGPAVYNQVTGEKFPSICQARWSHGKTCAVKYLSNGINGEDKFSKGKPAAAVIASDNATKAAAEVTTKSLMKDGMTREEAISSLPNNIAAMMA